MGNYLKIKKRKIILTFLLIFNQLILSSFAMNNRRVVISESEETKFPSKYWNEFKLLISSKKQNETYLLDQEVEQLERFVEETFDSKNIEDLKNLNESNIKIKTQFIEIGEELINSDIENKKANEED